MPVSVEALGIDKLSVAGRLDLIEQIWDSLPEQAAPAEGPDWHLAEPARRWAQEGRLGLGKTSREVLDPLDAGS